MATIDDKTLIDKLIAANGFFEDDPQVAQIVEYTNSFGNKTYGVTWSNESPERQRRYEEETYYVREPKVIWRKK